ncbi:MAG: GH3 auxin-responsive promoter family protein [Pyrinomonadaceae bacterium]
MLKLLKYAHHLRGKFENRSLALAAAEPEKTQRRFLFDLLKKNAGSSFGRSHGFDRIVGENDFRRRVPVRGYEDFRPFIDRIRSGEKGVLTEEEPLMFTLTSGTTDEPKYIPVTPSSQAFNAGLMRQWLYRAECDHPGLTARASVGVVSRAVEGMTSAGVPYGSASGLIYKNIPGFIRRAYAVPYAVSEIEDYDRRYFVLARFALARRVSLIATPNPGTLLRLADVCAENGEDLIRSIGDGTLGIELKGQKEIAAELSAMNAPDPERARQLERIAKEKGFLRFADCWPDLRLIGCWLGGSVGLQAGKLARHFGPVPLRDLGYLASEGSFTLPVEDRTSCGIPALESNYFEFVPEEELDSPDPLTLDLGQLEKDGRYGILLTTAAGLYRYRINDIIECTGFYVRTPLIRFLRKAGEMTSITGEKMHANHFVRAFEEIGRSLGLEAEQFRAVPDLLRNRYEIYLELKKGFSAAGWKNLIPPAIDHQLQRVNIEYAGKRRSKRLQAPVVFLMKPGWAEAGLRRHVAAGKRDTQYKPPILRQETDPADREFVAETIEMEISRSAAAQAIGI